MDREKKLKQTRWRLECCARAAPNTVWFESLFFSFVFYKHRAAHFSARELRTFHGFEIGITCLVPDAAFDVLLLESKLQLEILYCQLGIDILHVVFREATLDTMARNRSDLASFESMCTVTY